MSNQVTVFTAASSGMKWWFSIILGLLFLLLSLPSVYSISRRIIGSCSTGGTSVKSGLAPLLIHSIIFALIVRLILW